MRALLIALIFITAVANAQEVFELDLDAQELTAQYPAHIVKFHQDSFNIELSYDNAQQMNMEQHGLRWSKKYRLPLSAINAGMYYFIDDHGFLDGGVHMDSLLYPARKDNMRGRIIFGDTIGFQMHERRVAGHNMYTWKFRMMNDGIIKWKTGNLYWSIACIGRDAEGYYYLIHSRTPYTVEHLSAQLRDKLGIVDLMYLEGGPESTLVSSMETTVGSFETGFMENDENNELWNTPFAFIVVPK